MVCEFCGIGCMVTRFVAVKFWRQPYGTASFLNGNYMQNTILKIGIHKYKKVENQTLQETPPRGRYHNKNIVSNIRASAQQNNEQKRTSTKTSKFKQ